MAVKDELEAAGLRVTFGATRDGSETNGAPERAPTPPRCSTFLDALEEHEDVQHVYSNVDFDDAALEALA